MPLDAAILKLSDMQHFPQAVKDSLFFSAGSLEYFSPCTMKIQQ